MRSWLVATALVLAAGCTKTTVESFRSVPNARTDMAYVKAGVDFSRFTRLQAVPLEIYYYEGLDGPDPADLETVRRIFREAFLDRIGDDYELVDAPGPDVLFVRASLVDLELSAVPDELPVRGRAASLVAAGQLTFFMELADSESGEVLARAGDREKAPARIAGGATEHDWARTEEAAARWAQMFREFLDQNLGDARD
ncbi:MAG: DUF3313 family protein [Gammaproteobacteria bacterium]